MKKLALHPRTAQSSFAATEQLIYTTAISELMAVGFTCVKPLALLVLAQSKHESGKYTSHLFLTYHNAFGYSYTRSSKYQVKAGSNADNGVPIGAYKNVADSTKEICDWLGRRKATFQNLTTPAEYAAALKACGYYGDTVANYLAGLTRNYKPVMF